MTLSNFDWTDKNSVKWFIMRPEGHEGPYSIQSLIEMETEGSVLRDSRIWREGLLTSLSFDEVLERVHEAVELRSLEEELPPPLPPLPFDVSDDEDASPPGLPPLPLSQKTAGLSSEQAADESDDQSVDQTVDQTVDQSAEDFEDGSESTEESEEEARPPKKSIQKLSAIFLGVLLVSALTGYQWVKSNENFSIPRLPKMSPELHQRILSELKFDGWNRTIFFKEYVPADLSHIWLVTSGFQTCDVEASFTSVSGKLLSKDEPTVAFKSRTKLKDHIAEFSSFDFSAGNKLIPGLYEMDITARDCAWDGLSARLGNLLRPPVREYAAKTKVILYSKGAEAFNSVLDKLIRSKMELDLKNQDQEAMFWQGLQEKFQTLLAVTLQIEQLFIDFLEKDSRQFTKTLAPTVDQYTKKYGHFLTEFVVSNEAYFKDLSESQLKNISQKRTYEMTVRLMSKRIGYESMKIIEELQNLKNPQPKHLSPVLKKLKLVFKGIKDDINRKIIQVSEDRSI